VPVSLERRDLGLECGDLGRCANAKNILSQQVRFLLDRDEAEKTINDMKAQVEATWYHRARLRRRGTGRGDHPRRVRLTGVQFVRWEAVAVMRAPGETPRMVYDADLVW
jgi:hypothetical protein